MILLIEENDDLRKTIQDTLNLLDLENDFANTFDMGVAKISTLKPDMLMVDISLFDGFAISLVKICQFQNPSIKIVLMSGMKSTKIEPILKDLKINTFLKKPFGINELQNVIAVCQQTPVSKFVSQQ